MKRILVTILSVLYMISATGATVHIHYCMGEFMDAGFSHDAEGNCAKCGMKKSISKGCCKDEQKTIKASDHQTTKVSFDLAYYPATLPLPVHYTAVYNLHYAYSRTTNIDRAHAPPSLWRTCPIYIQVRNFRI